MNVLASLRDLSRRFRVDTSGLALIEFAFSLPLITAAGMYAIEISNLALMHLRVSQAALNLADNASRVGADSGTGTTQQLREIDIIDVLDGIKAYGKPWDLTKRGRVTLSSLETKGSEQRIHWQRCIGEKGLTAGDGYESSYGRTY